MKASSLPLWTCQDNVGKLSLKDKCQMADTMMKASDIVFQHLQLNQSREI